TKKGKRKYKPFALLSKGINEVKSFAILKTIEETILTSFRKPIVLVQKKQPFPLSEWISPNLFNVGVMLPYSGIHSLILDHIIDPAIVLTSANPSDIPMYIDNNEILAQAKNLSDYILLHDRTIHQRADDSVLRITDGKPVLIRRSRGWTPEPIPLPFDLKKVISLGVGPLLTSTGAIALKDRCFPTQFIGDLNTLESLDFLENSITHLSNLLNVDHFEAIGYDLHPSFLANTLAQKIAKKDNAELIGMQHHHAHAVALMIDNEINLDEEIIAIIADGVGYGEDGKIWGGEIFHSNYLNYERIGHLEEQPMVGGDRATLYPIRMFAGILSKFMDVTDIAKLLSENYSDSLPSKNEIQVLLVQLKNNLNVTYTTSTGRILASISSLLKACFERTYEGEPAIVLESLAYSGKADKIKFKIPDSNENIINTTSLIEQAYEQYKTGSNPADIALEVHKELARQFAHIAIEYAKEFDIKKIGFTGGVAYNQFITENISKIVKKEKMIFLTHKSLPCGDGAISSGQAIKAALKKIEK
ncbi:MAG: carbamoyltransferase HypF, partial [Candidatus Thorarchaeota archaeon]